uniref:hypothetical protein n=1 Tax=Gemmiger formicilis TaxID=745368 RepID=UPI003FF04BFC
MKKLSNEGNSVQYSAESAQSATHILWEQILYLLGSVMGKYSFKTYLGVMSDFVDEEIRQGIAQGLHYTGGHVFFEDNNTNNTCNVKVELFFSQQGCDKYAVKSAERELPKEMFIHKDIALLEKNGRIEFNVEKPEV